MRLRCLPAVFNDFGGIGRELYSAIIQPHFQQLYEAEVAEGNSGWAARRHWQRWLQHTSVTVAKGNFRILATMHHERRAPAPTPGTSTTDVRALVARTLALADVHAHRQPLVPAKSRMILGCQRRFMKRWI